ncbi:phospholipid cytidylyltransferase, putative [Entamoeba histolytica HM-1:IMSS-B]|uniref:ethanolamine-phosphate cytidylyltransferase n=6 Tax=Entamoeba histolytica TaxID=5759 RepID=C4M3N1_ENTH1|nr:phospholipid cytidylyltransferase, putative [Entamoeba histolytica HM-1:IMSS]EMD46053.1 ethanolaminephosphate cytidylyltransferase, putative [Entamoeba histolytica KU27]EMH78305.1 phospholipid cytidylyltransferase, putative [Entamoeba histolytica HM-1:IMSS-B]EMS16736.1 ethanolamine-phosphate cytidylyltransferase [Entamoeba histolytica HM-3:IMSS]ENY64984.1 ethanolamine-phosphate cytidylyltransferase, putative [Entamoeba histolytica HM-1:IMSS-A]GAT95933.1 phospholipid cytidylyltransferase put|eukprot:XP_654185.1 phospholipid cytidylyltransferase, putative [Entamoeba histolytica HM-1:IMSS]
MTSFGKGFENQFKHHLVKNTKPGVPRIWVDGCFDMFHWGHANVIRQAAAAFNYKCCLCVGLHSDKTITTQKAKPVMNEEERTAAVLACEWVDEVVDGIVWWCTPYDFVKSFNIDYVVHGDDIVCDAVTGKNCYWEIQEHGMLKLVPRTEGVSTTDLIYRMLNPTSQDHWTGYRHSILSIDKIRLFSEQKRTAKKDDTIVYLDGVFDLLHIGHYKLLKHAKEIGSYVIVGVYDDVIANKKLGINYPICNIGERVMSLLACGYVDNVVIGAPEGITKEMIEKMHINKVLHGKHEYNELLYKDAIEMNIMDVYDSGSTVTALDIINRIKAMHDTYEERNSKKQR